METLFEKPLENNTPKTPEEIEPKPAPEFFGIKVESDEKFLERTREDLEMLAGLPDQL